MTQHQRIKRLISVDEYHKMAKVGILSQNDKVELINGEILHMSPIGNNHVAIVTRITMLFAHLFYGKALVQVQGPIQIKDFSEPEPDVLLLKLSDDEYFNQHRLPADSFLLIEVSDTTYEFDKTIKLQMYAQARIPEYWIINIPEKQIELHSNAEGNIYKNITIARNEDVIQCAGFPDIQFKVSDILR